MTFKIVSDSFGQEIAKPSSRTYGAEKENLALAPNVAGLKRKGSELASSPPLKKQKPPYYARILETLHQGPMTDLAKAGEEQYYTEIIAGFNYQTASFKLPMVAFNARSSAQDMQSALVKLSSRPWALYLNNITELQAIFIRSLLLNKQCYPQHLSLENLSPASVQELHPLINQLVQLDLSVTGNNLSEGSANTLHYIIEQATNQQPYHTDSFDIDDESDLDYAPPTP